MNIGVANVGKVEVEKKMFDDKQRERGQDLLTINDSIVQIILFNPWQCHDGLIGPVGEIQSLLQRVEVGYLYSV